MHSLRVVGGKIILCMVLTLVFSQGLDTRLKSDFAFVNLMKILIGESRDGNPQLVRSFREDVRTLRDLSTESNVSSVLIDRLNTIGLMKLGEWNTAIDFAATHGITLGDLRDSLKLSARESLALEVLVSAAKKDFSRFEDNCISMIALASDYDTSSSIAEREKQPTLSAMDRCIQASDNIHQTEPRLAYSLGRFFFYKGDWNRSAFQFHRSLQYSNSDIWVQSWAHYYLGQIDETQQKYVAASLEYREALSGQQPLSAALVKLLKLAGSQAEALALRRAFIGLVPAVSVNRAIGNWQLVGYDLNDNDLDLGTDLTITLFWKPIHPGQLVPVGWMQLGDCWLEILNVRNLAPNPGFQLDEPSLASWPTGFPRSLFGDSPSNHAIIEASRLGHPTLALSLRNDAKHNETSVLSVPISVEAHGSYLLAVSAKGVELSNGGFGLICNSATRPQAPAYDGIGGYYPAPDWKVFATILMVPDDASQCQLYLENYRTTGEVLFDGILWVEIPPT